jgi:CBS domain containing-hemolysin-like protein
MSLELVIIVIATCLLLQAFFAGFEIALVSCDKIKMKSLAEGGSTRAKLVLKSFLEIERFISTSLVGINLSLITSTVILTFYIQDTYGKGKEFYVVLILSPLIVIFGQVVPKAVFQKRASTMVLWSIYPLWVASKIFSPILFQINLFIKGLFKLLGSTENPFITREELLHAIEGDETIRQGGYREKIIKRIFRFSETRVDEIMIPLIQVCALNEDTQTKDAVKIIKETGHSRIPIYHERVDNITGMLHAFDLLGAKPDDPIRDFSLTPFYVPETKSVDELLDEMKEKSAGMAVVVDEYGGAVGVIALEDILEEVVGEIEDEHEMDDEPQITLAADGSILADGRADIESFESRFGKFLSDEDREDIDTLGGLVFSIAGRVPSRGEVLSHESGLVFEVLDADPRRVSRLRIRNIPKEATE